VYTFSASNKENEMEIKREVLDELIRDYEKPEDLIGETGC